MNRIVRLLILLLIAMGASAIMLRIRRAKGDDHRAAPRAPKGEVHLAVAGNAPPSSIPEDDSAAS